MNTSENHTIHPYPLGISDFYDSIKFSFAGGRNKNCTLHIYKKGAEKPYLSVNMDNSDKTGDVFSCLIKKSALKNWPDTGYEYLYELDGNTYTDPYAPQITGRSHYGKNHTETRGVITLTSDIQNDKRPSFDTKDLIIYQMHVRGFSKHRSSGIKHKGTFKGIIEKIPYLKSLGINCILLLPAYDYNEYISEPDPIGLPDYIEYESKIKLNYWGYTDNAFYMAPKSSYASAPDNSAYEFTSMVKELHNEKIKVFMDIHFPGWANSAFICDCLHNWVINYHIDGFRVNQDVVDNNIVKNDPVLSDIVLLGNYWDNTQVFHQNLPAGMIAASGCHFANSNDGFMFKIRQFIRGDINNVWELIEQLVKDGYKSHDVETINYVATVNGFTLADSVSYNMKHNEANDENNYDGTDYNCSINCGVEGKTRRKKIIEKRSRHIRNELMLLMLSSGIPMLLAGDELGNTQNGNNNAYCQDNEISWLNWKDAGKEDSLSDYVKKLIEFRKNYITGDTRRYSDRLAGNTGGIPNISYHGSEPWSIEPKSYNRSGGFLISDKGLYVAVNMQESAYNFELPKLNDNCVWKPVMWSSIEKPCGFVIQPESVVVFARV